ncbi:sulfurtransferase complex subunit TusB [Oceanisphaera pacifica]|uniref:Sulfurtransferase complex subunit TusB n=1 Tax=Oceanisphaera pacifica TaxID=2818389 RepID=A0ABS3ND33_9GAMM|nr:sulfurtransferase complex subunit TusB [Oceanisphaera pacifica]MBO1518283.1 sulfurtransferase complex subunit TusB [Oceanisphaera pacifica]
MLHTIKYSPFSHQTLNLALSQLQPEDSLLLWQDGVIAASVTGALPWQAPLQALASQGRLYVMQEDLAARGLSHKLGELISMADWVTLVAEWGSPQAW